ncbi:hypothetical protein B7P43_G08036 [Cryptotermes secundus]|uniref:Uncharacterized protein n=1 Tax=Cryptotermes secundus TaxID=105785 RepID=A0A2J7R7Z4_9NEOP|nr:uncharacterized protein LOC111862858 isoform X2 [Cryptotermes secundus]PNF36953.1 hypothetical protein B7P43_G08036 [Cryptotermes secundus]
MMDTLQEQLKTLRETIDAFPIGAATCNEYSLENEIARTADTITLVSARLLMLRAQDKQRRLPQDTELLDLRQFSEVLDEYAEEISKASLRKLAWKNSIEASEIRRLIADSALDEPGTCPESFQILVDLLTTVTSLNCHLRGVLKEQRDTALQITDRRKELQLKLQNYKELLVAQELDWQEHAVGQERENIELKKRLQLKLEKLNVMRILMVNLIGFSNINYIKHQQWTDMLIEKQGLLSLQSFTPSDSAAQ